MTTTTNGTKILNDVMAVTDSRAAGAIVWWELSGLVDAAKLREAWDAAGLPDGMVPDDPNPSTALRRACSDQAEKRRLVRPLEGRDGYSLVEERADGTTLAYNQGTTCTVDVAGRLDIQPSTGATADTIRASYQTHLTHLVPSDIGGLLVRFASSLMALALRTKGGFYFLPPTAVEEFRKAAEIVRSVSGHVCYEIPAMRSKEAVKAVLDAIQREAATEASDLEAVLDAEDAGPRKLKTQARRCAEMEKKVAEYEGLLGVSMAEMQAKLQTLRARLSEAAIVAQQAKDAELAA